MTTNAKALQRLEIVIAGVAARTVSAVGDLVSQLEQAGLSEQAIRQRLEIEIESGSTLAELRTFATATVPGYTGDMAFRFARDTLSQTVARVDIDERIAKQEREAERADDQTQKERVEEIRDTFEAQGIDTTAWEDEELPEPPPDADLEDMYYWIGIEDERQCEVCAENHELSQQGPQPLSYWVEVGEPRSGACAGRENCRCILVPADAISKTEINTAFREMVKIPKK